MIFTAKEDKTGKKRGRYEDIIFGYKIISIVLGRVVENCAFVFSLSECFNLTSCIQHETRYREDRQRW